MLQRVTIQYIRAQIVKILSAAKRHYGIASVSLPLAMAALNVSAAYPFADDFERGTANWVGTGTWGLTTARSASPTHAATDSPGAYYTNNTDSALRLAAPLNLSAASHPAICFQHAYALEPGYDFGRVEVSVNGGGTWTVLASYSGNQATMTREQLDLSAYAGNSSVLLRFHLVTDATVVMDGWYIDDVIIGEAPSAVAIKATQTNRNSVAFSWPAATPGNFAGYRLYRAASPGVDWRTASVVAEVGDIAATNFTDIKLSPKTAYYYRLAVVGSNGLLTLGSELSVTTRPGMDYPFVDNGEGGGGTWIADAPWAISAEDSFSAGHAWSDSPGTNYANGIPSQALTLSAPVYLAGLATAPVLCFTHKYAFSPGDYANVEISTNFGADWSSLVSFNGFVTNAWRPERISLAAYTNCAVLLRFRITTGGGATADGWHVDDISVAESPAVVQAPVVDNVTSHSIRITWAANTNSQFAAYWVYRSTSSGANYYGTRIAVITNQATITVTDTNLALDTLYYYRVYAVSAYGAFSGDSPVDNSVRTLNNPLPFADGFEGGTGNWNFSGNWNVTSISAYSGNFSLTDSPQGTYGNSEDSAATTALDLSGAVCPVLRFWQRYRLEAGDFGWIEISTDGINWPRIGGINGIRTNWTEQRISLAQWKGSSNLRVRFHMATDGGGVDDGWYIDDVSVVDMGAIPATLPIQENYESEPTNWLVSGWMRSTNQVYAGNYCMEFTGIRIAPETPQVFELAKPIALTNLVNPQITCAIRGTLVNYSNFRILVSPDGGVSWPELSQANLDNGFNGVWTNRQASLQGYLDQTIRLRFVIYPFWGTGPYTTFAVDKITIAEMPEAVTLVDTTPHLRSVDLNWTASPLGTNFARYEVYRATHAGVTIADTRIGLFTSISTTNFADTGLDIGATYYYKVFTVDGNDTFTPSNERSITTVPVLAPLSDSFTNTAQWVTTGTWGAAPGMGPGGTACLSDSPQGDYDNSSDTYAVTAVNLNGTFWPVLEFTDKFHVVPGDWGWVEVSSDGGTWGRIYGVSGVRNTWQTQRIDLSQWKTQPNLRLRFHLATDGSGTDDGWQIANLSITDHNPGLASLPILEGFEAGLSNWLSSGWSLSTNSYAGTNGAGYLMPLLTPETGYPLTYDREITLTNLLNPQLTLWISGALESYSNFRVLASRDGGLSWLELPGINTDNGFRSGWVRKQASLQDYVNQTIRLRALIYDFWGSAPASQIYIDKLSVQEMPAPAQLQATVPHLRSVDLEWSASPLGSSFQRYEVYQATHSGVGLGDTLIGTFTNISATNLTATGLSIGSTYYYRVYTIDVNDTYTPSNERSTTTVPVGMPFADEFTNLTQWVTTGTWGLAPTGGRDGGPCLTDSPIGDYENSSTPYALTAINLNGSTWPTLKFWDRYRLADGDFALIDVSTDGANWSRVYGIAGVRSAWAEQSIDLSPWKTQPNLRIRLWMSTDAGGTEDGWYIDSLSISDHAPEKLPLPVVENFESGITNWLHANWNVSTNEAFNGSWSARSTYGPRMCPETPSWLELDHEIVLTNCANPQLTFWMKGRLENYSYFRALISTDGGMSWPELGVVNADNGFTSDWVRRQASLQNYVNQTIRLRFQVVPFWGSAPYTDMSVDKVTVEEAPTMVNLNPIDQISVSSMRLTWTPAAITNFKAYYVYRDDGSGVSDSSTLLAVITNAATTSFTATNLVSRKTYFYRVYIQDTTDTINGSNLASAMTTGQPMGWADNFETNQFGWTFTGQWTRQPGVGRNGGYALVDSHGDYLNSSSTYAQLAVDLTGTSWPVLKFSDHYAIADNDWARLYVSGNAGSTWGCYYGGAGTRTNWQEHSIDLSPWKGCAQVWIRFQMETDGGTQGDGWYIDDVSVSENPSSQSGYPFYDSFEHGATNWLAASWSVSTNQPYAGSNCIRSIGDSRLTPETVDCLVFSREIVLTNAHTPILTFWMRGYLDNYSFMRPQISSDHGISWYDLPGVNAENGYRSDWVRAQVSLAAYTNQTIRLRWVQSDFWGSAPYVDFYIDGIGWGEPVPEAPAINLPADTTSVPILRPFLSVKNAIDYQSDPLTYRFEVYSDVNLSNLVSQVPAVSSGTTITSWQLDQNLQNNAQYWWRCRADNGSTNGPWSPTATFFVNQVNHAPVVVDLAGPPNGSIVTNIDFLFWYPTVDPDAGDYVAAYHLQVARDAQFTLLMVNATNLTLGITPTESYWAFATAIGGLTGFTNVVLGNTYYWRVRASDSWGLWSDWSEGASFRYGPIPAPELQRMRKGTNGSLQLEWTGGPVYIEFKPALTNAYWQTIAGPLSGTNWVFHPDPANPVGFYRLRQ